MRVMFSERRNLESDHICVYLKSCEISPAEVLVIGDTESDIKSGIAAGAAQSIGVLTGAHVKEQLESAGATSVLQSATQLLTLIN